MRMPTARYRGTGPATLAILALLVMPAIASAQQAADLGTITVTGTAESDAVRTAPSQGSLAARSAQSIISDEAIRDFTSPIADYTQILSLTPGVFGYSPNGVGLGQASVMMRGQSDSFFDITFDGIPFNDTNGVSHHSWVFFPSQFLGGAVVDRSPGTAATIGQATFGGTIDLRSRVLEPNARTSVTLSDGSWNTRLVNLEEETGNFGPDGKSNLLLNAQKMKSDGYETYNDQDRTAASLKYRLALSADATLTVFSDALELKNNTPNIKGLQRSLYDAGNYTYLLSADPTRGDYYGYNYYKIVTSFNYVGIVANLDSGWKLDDKAYVYSYHNKQNYDNANGLTASPPGYNTAVDKLNAYVTMGDLLRASRETDFGIVRTGFWLDVARSHRYQIPTDPRTWIDLPAPNFFETYTTTTVQPYLEYEFKVTPELHVTPGIKYASYRQAFYHAQDNGKAVGTLGGKLNKAADTITGGAPSVSNALNYSDTLPAIDVHYMLAPNWSTYVQWAVGDQIPSTSISDVPGARVGNAGKATVAKTVQVGTVWNGQTVTVSADAFHSHLDGSYTALPPDPSGNVSWVLSGTEVDEGIEAEANVALTHQFNVYVNGTLGSLKYANGQWVQGAPQDTESVALNYRQTGWNVGLQANRVGRNYYDDSNGVHQAFTIDPVILTNLYSNYTIARPLPGMQRFKLQLAIDNLLNRHSIVGIAGPAAGSSSAKPSANDVLTILPARSVSLTATADF